MIVTPGAFRLLLSLAVFVHHLSRLGIGSAAVYIFFALSGFWICRMWSAKYSALPAPYLTYIVSRSWRLVPTFALIAGLTIVGLLLLGRSFADLIGSADLAHFIASHLLIIGYNSLSGSVVGPAWSLDIEMQFYIVAPLLIAAAIHAPTMVLIGAAAVSAASAYLFGKTVALSFLLFFVIGILAAQADWRPSRRLAIATAATACGVLVGLLVSPYSGVILGGANREALYVWNEAANVVLAALMLPYAIATTALRSNRIDAAAGDLSFIVYLAHWLPVQWQAQFTGSIADRLPYAMTAIGVTFLASWLIWRFFDQPINQARGRWVDGRRSEAADAAVPLTNSS
jgi:peptidoglycan/LPS O-acetylase OafA/YrhL